jgi:transcriptional regulator with XRE-family HTH domain
MSYGHAGEIAGRAGNDPVPGAEKPVPVIDPALYWRDDVRRVLAALDIGALYRILQDAGVSQRQIAGLTGQSQSEVSEIVAGRRTVESHQLLKRIVTGLGIPPELMGLSWWGPNGTWYGFEGAYPGEGTAIETPEGVSAAMLRRHLIAHGGKIIVGVLSGSVPSDTPIAKVGELLDSLGELPPAALPSRLTHAHVAQVHDLRRRLDETRRTFGGDPATSGAAATRAEQLLTVPGPEQVKQAMMTAVAHLRLHAGLAAFDAGLYHHALHHYAQALELATKGGDAHCQARALHLAGLAAIENGHPNEGLKLCQAAQVATWTIPPDDPRRASAQACPLMDSATALAMLGEHQQAYRCAEQARDLWSPTPGDSYGDMDRAPALLEIDRGRLDIAEQFATASVRRWENITPVGRTRSGIILATIHVKAGEQRGLQLAHRAITDTTKLTSVRARRQLLPLADTLDTRRGSDYQELARTARQVAVTWA